MTRSEEISACEAAIELGMELSNLYALLRAQRLRGRKVDGHWRVNASDVRKRSLARREREAPARSERNRVEVQEEVRIAS